ncbi:cytochrome P450 [Sodiomyces alkalinus F11]|uniref:Cytochrome P450 n=1 Tax=Sodiomyces alkalinus (strain CBS 110278 / VKM F-3762 / F11) TaxID=1314773 RepID=A0A3N2PTJ1_SODAK|nr:cytochrome P450 [Sodiomyces alkalinus F11]ROT37832.1 cytochrome P450 [Sodiomyces alkalinus F11]
MPLLRGLELPLAGILLVITLCLESIVHVLRKSTSRIPGPWYTMWTDVVLRYNMFYGRRGQYVHKLHAKYGPVVRIGPNQVDMTDMQAYKTIYSTREVFLKSPWYKVLTGNVVDAMFTTSDPHHHRRIRRLLSAPLSEAALASSHALCRKKAELAVQRMRDESREKGAADVYKWWMFMTTDIIGELTFGRSFDMLAKSERDQYAIDVEGIGRTSVFYTTFTPLHRLLRHLPIPVVQRAYRTSRNLASYADEAVARYKSLAAEEDPGKPHNDNDDEDDNDNDNHPKLFEKVFTAEKQGAISATEIRDNAQSYIVAGSDTTAVTLTYLVWSVCRAPPHVRSALLAEMAAWGDDPSAEDLKGKGARYLNCVVDETLRLYGAAQTGLPRLVPPGGAVLAGYGLDAGTTVEAQAYSLHRDGRVFGDPETFDPGRWEGASREMREQLVPFGGGTRACIGLHLAKMELRLGTFLFFRTFPDAEVAAPDDEMNMETFFVLSPKAGRCLIRVH